MAKVTDAMIRDFLGHNGNECYVLIRSDGIVERYGSPIPTDRSLDLWTYMGTRAEVARDVARWTPPKK